MDYSFLTQMLIYTLLQFAIISCVYGSKIANEGVCVKEKQINNEFVNVSFCCAFYEMKNNRCIGCSAGFYSEEGSNCKPCPANVYGRKCFLSCECVENQTCHHIEGCINVPTTTFQMTKKLFQGYSTSDSVTTYVYNSYQEENNEQNNGPTPYDQTKLHVIYSVCIAGLLVVITICSVCIYRLKTKSIEEGNRQGNELQNTLNIAFPTPETFVRLEGIYDEIDEEFRLPAGDILPTGQSIVRNEPNSDNNSESEIENMQNGDYLNPYQPIVEYSGCHEYTTVNVHHVSTSTLNGFENLSSIVHQSDEENPLENLNAHHYLDITNPQYEYPMNK